jgi:hypothetical protein
VAQLRGVEREIKNKPKKEATMRAFFTHGHGTFRRGLRGTAREREFVCGSFASHFVVVIIRWFLSLSF